MKVAVDALPLLGRTGVSNYLMGLFGSLPGADPTVEYRLYFRTGPRLVRLPDFSFAPNVSSRRILVPNRILEGLWTFRESYVPFSDRLFGMPDVYFSTMYFTPVLKCPVVSVFYDITPFKVEEYAECRPYMKVRLGNLVKRSRYIIAISESSRRDLCAQFGADPYRVFAVPLACGAAYRPLATETAEPVLKKYGLKPGYILYVGNMGPHKNVTTLLRAFRRLIREGGTDSQMVICGSVKWGSESVKLSGEPGFSGRVTFLDYVPDPDLPAIYAGAGVFAYISLYEGFGLPVLEAMACGRPVITSSVSSMPEVAGGAALLVDPRSEEEVFAALLRVLSDDKLAADMSAASLRRAAEFSWEKTARETLSIFKKAVY